MKLERAWSEDIWWGVGWGLAMSVVLIGVITITLISSGPSRFEELGIAFTDLVMLYVLFGIAGGVVLGVLRPMASTVLGAGGVGWLVGVVVMLGFSTFFYGADALALERLEVVALAGITGIPIGIVLRLVELPGRPTRPPTALGEGEAEK